MIEGRLSHFSKLCKRAVAALADRYAWHDVDFFGPRRSDFSQMLAPAVKIPRHGSEWMIQIVSTTALKNKIDEYHQRQLVDCSDPTYSSL